MPPPESPADRFARFYLSLARQVAESIGLDPDDVVVVSEDPMADFWSPGIADDAEQTEAQS